ncbi:ImmA/IrrE family metallo-endopeptidase [Streptomyces lydicus]|uniref:ImmA/IrrE family metallo-endopeptidase n=1 Tax=Streptomyces lydicus TaxID=47763 RepID=UPI001F509BFA|nr:ImmA/IrrE family metallo-endopeptidase [Streptomyces lydicus]MCZ1006795.1 ImmA/IrrE family metallo-endopeptidase [Streptomyces lydicus]
MWFVRSRRQGDLLAELNLPRVTSVRDLRGEVSRRTGRTVVLEPREQASSLCGACAITESHAYVFYDPRTSPTHQDHIIAHEFGHLLLGHHETRPLSALAPSLITTMDPAVVQMMLGRTQYDEVEERDTEALASLLQRKIIDRWLCSDESSGDDVQDRVTHTLLRRREARR